MIDLSKHTGHRPTITQYGNKITMECSCGADLMEQDAINLFTEEKITSVCSIDDDECLSCGS